MLIAFVRADFQMNPDKHNRDGRHASTETAQAKAAAAASSATVRTALAHASDRSCISRWRSALQTGRDAGGRGRDTWARNQLAGLNGADAPCVRRTHRDGHAQRSCRRCA